MDVFLSLPLTKLNFFLKFKKKNFKLPDVPSLGHTYSNLLLQWQLLPFLHPEPVSKAPLSLIFQ